MYTLSRITRSPMMRRQPSYWQATEDFFRPFMEMVNSPMRTSVKETEGAYLFDAELPGFESSEIELSVLDGVLTISAEHKEEGEGEGENENNAAFASRSVRRSFTVEGVDEENIAAEYKNGILRVTLPKQKAPEAPEARKIEVK